MMKLNFSPANKKTKYNLSELNSKLVQEVCKLRGEVRQLKLKNTELIRSFLQSDTPVVIKTYDKATSTRDDFPIYDKMLDGTVLFYFI